MRSEELQGLKKNILELQKELSVILLEFNPNYQLVLSTFRSFTKEENSELNIKIQMLQEMPAHEEQDHKQKIQLLHEQEQNYKQKIQLLQEQLFHEEQKIQQLQSV